MPNVDSHTLTLTAEQATGLRSILEQHREDRYGRMESFPDWLTDLYRQAGLDEHPYETAKTPA